MSKTPVIIDTDPGTDDAAALGIALFSEELDVRLITTVGGNVSLDHVTDNVLKLLKFWNKKVPVARGATGPLVRGLVDASDVHGKSGLDGYEFAGRADACLLPDVAVDAAYKTIMGAREPMTLIAIGPLTNVALLLKVHPDVRGKISRIALMGGALGRGNKGVLSEFNIATDPEAASIVFSAGVPVTMVGLEIGNKAALSLEDVELMRRSGKTGKMLYSLFEGRLSRGVKRVLSMYDPTAVAYVTCPQMFKTVNTYVGVELTGEFTAGSTLVDLDGLLGQDPNVTVCTDIDSEAFRSWFLESVAACG